MQFIITNYCSATCATVLVIPHDVIIELNTEAPLEKQIPGCVTSECGEYLIHNRHVISRQDASAALAKVADDLAKVARHRSSSAKKSSKKEEKVGLVDTNGGYRLISSTLYNNIKSTCVPRDGYTGEMKYYGYTLIYNKAYGSSPRRVIVSEDGNTPFTLNPAQQASTSERVAVNDRYYNANLIQIIARGLNKGEVSDWGDYAVQLVDDKKISILHTPTNTKCGSIPIDHPVLRS